MTKLLLVLSFFCPMCSHATSSQELLDVLQRTPWTADNKSTLEDTLPTSDAVRALLNLVYEGGDDASTEQLITAVSDFRFIDAKHDGNISLVASIDVSGREFFNTVIVLRRHGTTISQQEFAAWNVRNLDNILLDLNNDGETELLIPTPVEPYDGTNPIATIPIVYVSDGEGFVNAVHQFSEYYRKVILRDLTDRLHHASDKSVKRVLSKEIAELGAALQ